MVGQLSWRFVIASVLLTAAPLQRRALAPFSPSMYASVSVVRGTTIYTPPSGVNVSVTVYPGGTEEAMLSATVSYASAHYHGSGAMTWSNPCQLFAFERTLPRTFYGSDVMHVTADVQWQDHGRHTRRLVSSTGFRFNPPPPTPTPLPSGIAVSPRPIVPNGGGGCGATGLRLFSTPASPHLRQVVTFWIRDTDARGSYRGPAATAYPEVTAHLWYWSAHYAGNAPAPWTARCTCFLARVRLAGPSHGRERAQVAAVLEGRVKDPYGKDERPVNLRLATSMWIGP
jgi:hypothetical protein